MAFHQSHANHDPSAGSPTETLLRLLLPLSEPVRISFMSFAPIPRRDRGSPVQEPHWSTQSVVATGGVYKGQGQSRDELCDPPLLGIPSWWRIIAITSPNYAHVLAHSECKHMHKCFIGLPTPFDAGLLPLHGGSGIEHRPLTPAV